MAQDQALIKLEGARKLLAEARTIGEAKHVADIAHAAKVYAQRQKLGEEAVRSANAIVLDAERRIGEMLRATQKNVGSQGVLRGRDSSGGTRKVPPESTAARLDDLGLDKKLSSRAQKLAKLTRETFEQVKSGDVTLAAAFRELPVPSNKVRKPRGLRRRRLVAEASERVHAAQIELTAKRSSLAELLEHLAGELSTLDLTRLGAHRTVLIEHARRAHELLGEFLTATETTHAHAN